MPHRQRGDGAGAAGADQAEKEHAIIAVELDELHVAAVHLEGGAKIMAPFLIVGAP